jgi:2-polyprenyl-6-methoxyphenol hydroxylase-like FAD-dependent oxidoreductase
MKSLKEINVLISGASVAGLNTAYWLAKYSFKVTIIERSSHIRSGGQALDVRGPALYFTQSVIPFTLKNYAL